MKNISPVKSLLHLEGVLVFVAAVAAYIHLQGSLWLFVVLALAPDLSMVGYLHSKQLGALLYDAVHTYIAPGILLALGLLTNTPLFMQIALIWLAHIGGDRAVGYGLKYPTDFKDTHLQRV
jgi:hypothetical protein